MKIYKDVFSGKACFHILASFLVLCSEAANLHLLPTAMKLPSMSVLSFDCLIFTRKCGHFFDDLIISGDELFSDTYPMKLVDDCIYEVYGKVRLG